MQNTWEVCVRICVMGDIDVQVSVCVCVCVFAFACVFVN